MSESAGTFAFTLDRYRTLLESLLDAGYSFRSFHERLADDSVLLRHDVDLSVPAAVRMAELEASLGVEATYHVLVTSPLYNPFESTVRERIRTIESLGHDVALHFSTHAYWETEPPESALLERVEAELDALSAVLDGEAPPTVSFHIPPEWVLDRQFPDVRNTYAPRYFSEVGYVADSGQRWREKPPVVEGLPDRVQVLVHPGLWDDDADFDACVERAIETATDHTREHARREFIEGVYS